MVNMEATYPTLEQKISIWFLAVFDQIPLSGL